MYNVTGIGLTAVILYFLSYIFYLNGFYSRNSHRKIWNIILAGSFLLAAVAGLFLALQINYKWNIPFVKTILKWHVDFGIALSFTGLFHFIWHFSYFIRKEKNNEKSVTGEAISQRSAKQNAVNLFIIGFVSTSVQLLMMREIMNISGGYELVAGTFPAAWLIGSAAGSYASGHSQISDLRKLNTIFGLNIILSVILMLLLGRLYLNPGETPSFFLSIIYTIIVLLPFTFVSGFIFMKILSVSGINHKVSSGSSFSIETAGGIISGVVIPIFSYRLFSTYQFLMLICTFFLSYVLISFVFISGKGRIVTLASAVCIVVLIIVFKPDRIIREVLLPGINVISSTDTPYGNVTKGEYGGEQSIYYNHRLLQYRNDETEREENVHYAMLQHGNPEKVLVVSGDISSVLGEVMKYPVKRVFYVERDPGLLKVNRSDKLANVELLKVINTDAYRFIHETNEKFDVILLIIPPPSTLLINRFYTTDFYSSLAKRLNEKGIIMCSPGIGENYFNKESTILYSSVFNSLKAVFKNVIPIVGNKLYYIASNDSLTERICYLAEKRAIKNIYVNSDFLSDDLIRRKSDEFMTTINRDVAENKLSTPSACFHYQSYSLSRTDPGLYPSLFLIIAIFILPVFSVRRRNLLMYSSAGALAGFEIIALLTIQSSAGNMYNITGLVIAGLMTGLALGTAFDLTSNSKQSGLINSSALVLFYLLMVLVINKLLHTEIRSA